MLSGLSENQYIGCFSLCRSYWASLSHSVLLHFTAVSLFKATCSLFWACRTCPNEHEMRVFTCAFMCVCFWDCHILQSMCTHTTDCLPLPFVFSVWSLEHRDILSLGQQYTLYFLACFILLSRDPACRFWEPMTQSKLRFFSSHLPAHLPKVIREKQAARNLEFSFKDSGPHEDCWLCFLIDSTPCATVRRGSRPGGITSKCLTGVYWWTTWSQTQCMNLQSGFHKVNETASGAPPSSRERQNPVCVWNGLGLSTEDHW